MHTPPASARHHRWPAWVRVGLVMKPTAGMTAGVTPRQPTAAVTAEVTAEVTAARAARLAGLDWLAAAWLTPGTSSASAPVMSTAASHLPGSRLVRAAVLVRRSCLTPGSPSGRARRFRRPGDSLAYETITPASWFTTGPRPGPHQG